MGGPWSPKILYPEWQNKYQVALLELDRKKLLERVKAAETAIFNRIQAISPEHAAERQAIEDFGSCFSLSALANLASSSCTIRAVCALCRIWVNNAPRAIPNISIPSNNRTSGTELTIETVYQQSCCAFQRHSICSVFRTNCSLQRILNVYEHRNLLTLFGFWNGTEKSSRKSPAQQIIRV